MFKFFYSMTLIFLFIPSFAFSEQPFEVKKSRYPQSDVISILSYSNDLVITNVLLNKGNCNVFEKIAIGMKSNESIYNEAKEQGTLLREFTNEIGDDYVPFYRVGEAMFEIKHFPMVIKYGESKNINFGDCRIIGVDVETKDHGSWSTTFR